MKANHLEKYSYQSIHFFNITLVAYENILGLQSLLIYQKDVDRLVTLANKRLKPFSTFVLLKGIVYLIKRKYN